MGKSPVTESADELIYLAESDIISFKELLAGTYYPADRKYNIICFHAAQAVEKLLKGFIISNGKTVERIHDLDILHQAVAGIDVSFAEIKSECVFLNTFAQNIKYSSKITITKQDIDKIIKSLENVCNFPPIQAMRNSFSKKHNYKIVTELKRF